MRIPLMHQLLAFALLVALSSVAYASPESDIRAMQSELQLLRKELQELRGAPHPAAPAVSAEPLPENLNQRLTAVELKVDEMKAADVEGGALSGLSVTGYLDVLYSSNTAAKTNGFVFGNTSSGYVYDTTNRGDVFLDIKKSFAAGPMAPNVEITLQPARSASSYSSYNAQGESNRTLINTAQFNYPVSPATTVFGGQVGAFSGYEQSGANQSPFITHNLLFDFSGPSLLTGMGFSGWMGSTEVWAWRAFLGNPVGQAANTATNQNPSLMARVDYQPTSTIDFGVSALVGKNTPVDYAGSAAATVAAMAAAQAAGVPWVGVPVVLQRGPENLSYIQMDINVTRLDESWFAQIDYGQNEHAAFNGNTATWWGLSLMRTQKFKSDMFGWMGWSVRYDYLNNQNNGGGGPNLFLMDRNGVGIDSANGFGIGAECLAAGGVGCDGANRESLSLGLQFYPHQQLAIKAEARWDRSSENTFLYSDGNYRRDNALYSLQAVYSF